MHSLNSALDRVSGQLHTPTTLHPEGKKCLVASAEGGWVGPRARLGTWEMTKISCTLPGTE